MRATNRSAVLTVGISSALWAIFTAPCLAADAPPEWARQVAVEGQVGYGAPLGALGLSADADVWPWLSISAGIGADLFDPRARYSCDCHGGLRQVAFMPRLRLPILDGATFVTLGIGLSRDARPDLRAVDAALVRQDDELGIEHRFANGIRTRAFAGIGFVANDPTVPAFSGTVYVGAALGYAVAPNPERSSATVGSWYGWQPLLSDALAATVAVTGRGNQQATRDALAIFAVPPAIIHVAHHNYGRAVASAALRGLLPYLLSRGATPDENGQTDKATPIVVGAVIAGLVDDLLLSWKN